MIKPETEQLWAKQDQHQGDRWRLFAAIAAAHEASTAFYPGCFVDIAPSFVFPSVTYLDTDSRSSAFFADVEGVLEIIASHEGALSDPEITFVHADYSAELDLPDQAFDLLISLYAGFISEYCTQHLKIGGTLLVNPSHGDAAMASIDPRYKLAGAVVTRSGNYQIRISDLDTYLIPKKSAAITIDGLHRTGRGIGYTKSPFAYLFTRIR